MFTFSPSIMFFMECHEILNILMLSGRFSLHSSPSDFGIGHITDIRICFQKSGRIIIQQRLT